MAGAMGPLDQQYVRPTMKNVAISTMAAGLFPFNGKAVVKLERIKGAAVWIAKPHMSNCLRPKRPTVKVFTSTMNSCSTDYIPLIASAW